MQKNSYLREPSFYGAIVGYIGFFLGYFKLSTLGISYSINALQLMTFDGKLGKFDNMVMDKSPIIYFVILVPIVCSGLLFASLRGRKELLPIFKWALVAVTAFFVVYFSFFFVDMPDSSSGTRISFGGLFSYGPGFGLWATFFVSILLLFEPFYIRYFKPASVPSPAKTEPEKDFLTDLKGDSNGNPDSSLPSSDDLDPFE